MEENSYKAHLDSKSLSLSGNWVTFPQVGDQSEETELEKFWTQNVTIKNKNKNETQQNTETIQGRVKDT